MAKSCNGILDLLNCSIRLNVKITSWSLRTQGHLNYHLFIPLFHTLIHPFCQLLFNFMSKKLLILRFFLCVSSALLLSHQFFSCRSCSTCSGVLLSPLAVSNSTDTLLCSLFQHFCPRGARSSDASSFSVTRRTDRTSLREKCPCSPP